MKKTLFLTAVLMAFAQTAAAETSTTTVDNCAIQEVLPGKNMTGAFVNFHHKGAAVEIVSAEIPSVTSHIELHSMEMKDNVMTMVPLTNPKLEEGVREFKKGSDHVMVMSIPDDKLPKVGETHTMTFKFSNGTQASCDAIVKSIEEVMKEADANMMMDH
ncbi:MAG: copper chaperone PCu(A)C [Alcaligenaceae bacterium]|nr:copper chaperone PCu(A)C [Alcaligenaceae bacterium]